MKVGLTMCSVPVYDSEAIETSQLFALEPDHEAHLSAQQPPSGEDAWFSAANEDTRWPRDPRWSSSQGSHTNLGLGVKEGYASKRQ